jgi:hypothetical protein
MDKRLETAAAIDLLEQGKLEMEGLVPWGSNYTFLVRITHDSGEVDAIYKPSRGERPLWDFRRGTLGLRERAAYLVSERLGWHLVPPTVLRDGPHGWGSVQYFVEHDPEQHYLTLAGRYVDQVKLIALFDALVNNADRKSGHVLLDGDGRLWAIDHGVCFHAESKLRTVIWGYAGEPIPNSALQALVRFREAFCHEGMAAREELRDLLSNQELLAMERRLEGLIAEAVFPSPGPGRHYPWPLV